MRKAFCWVMLIGILCSVTAFAETPAYSVQELKDQTQSGWHQVYTAHGRTIAIDIDIEVPDVDAAPVLKAILHPPIGEPQASRFAAQYKAPAGANAGNYEFRNISSIASNFVFSYNTGAAYEKGESENNVSTPERDLLTFDLDIAYAENNPLTVREAFQIAKDKTAEIWGEGYDLALERVVLLDQYKNRSTGEKLRDKGAYRLYCNQVLHGLPLLANLGRTFKTRLYEIDGESWEHAIPFTSFLQIKDADAYSLVYYLLQETELLYADMPLVSFEEVKAAYEQLIAEGRIRQIISLRFGYMDYIGPERDGVHHYLVPSWVAVCEYYENPQEEKRGFEANSSFYETLGYTTAVVNAQTGQVLDPEDGSDDRALMPAIIGW